jgi:hypothetical protein
VAARHSNGKPVAIDHLSVLNEILSNYLSAVPADYRAVLSNLSSPLHHADRVVSAWRFFEVHLEMI